MGGTWGGLAKSSTRNNRDSLIVPRPLGKLVLVPVPHVVPRKCSEASTWFLMAGVGGWVTLASTPHSRGKNLPVASHEELPTDCPQSHGKLHAEHELQTKMCFFNLGQRFEVQLGLSSCEADSLDRDMAVVVKTNGIPFWGDWCTAHSSLLLWGLGCSLRDFDPWAYGSKAFCFAPDSRLVGA